MPIILEDLFLGNIGNKIGYGGEKIYPYDKLRVSNGDVLRLKFISKQSVLPEGVVMKVDGGLKIEDDEDKNNAFWYEKPKSYIDIEVKTKNGELFVCNNWKDEDGEIYSLRGNNGMKIEKIKEKIRKYHCNFGFDDVDFAGMIFEVELLNGDKLESLMD